MDLLDIGSLYGLQASLMFCRGLGEASDFAAELRGRAIHAEATLGLQGSHSKRLAATARIVEPRGVAPRAAMLARRLATMLGSCS